MGYAAESLRGYSPVAQVNTHVIQAVEYRAVALMALIHAQMLTPATRARNPPCEIWRESWMR